MRNLILLGFNVYRLYRWPFRSAAYVQLGYIRIIAIDIGVTYTLFTTISLFTKLCLCALFTKLLIGIAMNHACDSSHLALTLPYYSMGIIHCQFIANSMERKLYVSQ